MAARRNRKRVKQRRRQLQLPQVNWHRVVTGCAALAVLAAVYVSTVWLMNRPIDAVVIKGRFERVSAMQLEEVLGGYVRDGFLSADLGAIRAQAVEIPWVASANVRRRWPGTIEVVVAEQEPAACWGDTGLLNTHGELFLADSSHVPAELPRLSGPAGSETRVARLYFEVEEQLEQRGLAAVEMELDARGAWSFRLNNGVLVRLGAEAVEQRLTRFLAALDHLLASQPEQVDYIDMRYPNGFAIGWKQDPEPHA